MTSSFVEYKSNNFCNSCLNERIDNLSDKNDSNKDSIFVFGIEIDLKEEVNEQSHL